MVRRVLRTAASAGAYQLRNRAVHVWEEAARVPQFRDICNSSAASGEKLSQLAALMDASHASCRSGAKNSPVSSEVASDTLSSHSSLLANCTACL